MQIIPILKTVVCVFCLFSFVPAAWGMGANKKAALFPDELVKFTPYENNPVFTGDKAPAWDEYIRERCWILKEENMYRMWYGGYMSEGVMRLGYATSEDGLAWKRYRKNPLYSAHWIEDVCVVKKDGRYYLFAEGLEDKAHIFVSGNGIAWQRLGPIKVLSSSGEPISEGPLGTPVAFNEKGIWYLLYERNDLGIWLARSEDLTVWRNVQDEPVLEPGPQEYDNRLIAANQVVKYNGRYYLYYHGRSKASPNWGVNIAVSEDLWHW